MESVSPVGNLHGGVRMRVSELGVSRRSVTPQSVENDVEAAVWAAMFEINFTDEALIGLG